MTQQTQFLMIKDSDILYVTDDDLETYLTAGYVPQSIRYSEGGEGDDQVSQVLMVKGSDAIRVRPDAVIAYRAAGYTIQEMLYGANTLHIAGNITVTDVPAIVSLEVGTVDETTLVITFLDDVTADDFTAGWTLEINAAPAEISAAEQQIDHKVIHLTIDAVAHGDTVTLAYAEADGNIRSTTDATILDDMDAVAVTNNVSA